MTASVTDHYANHLAPIYSWMVGDFDAACANADSFYQQIGLSEGHGRTAIDLGCGHGIHAVPLARRGFRVLALDTSAHLLSELESVAHDLPIAILHSDLTKFPTHLGDEKAALIACMGDTLTHLSTVDAVHALIGDAAASLAPDGTLTLSFRDYSTRELIGSDRFIPVQSDDHRIHTCFLEYHPETILVHDILQTRKNSTWEMTVSAYPKLRLAPDAVVAIADSYGLSLSHHSVHRGMLYYAFTLTPETAK